MVQLIYLYLAFFCCFFNCNAYSGTAFKFRICICVTWCGWHHKNGNYDYHCNNDVGENDDNDNGIYDDVDNDDTDNGNDDDDKRFTGMLNYVNHTTYIYVCPQARKDCTACIERSVKNTNTNTWTQIWYL